jgi:hypothetical protein
VSIWRPGYPLKSKSPRQLAPDGLRTARRDWCAKLTFNPKYLQSNTQSLPCGRCSAPGSTLDQAPNACDHVMTFGNGSGISSCRGKHAAEPKSRRSLTELFRLADACHRRNQSSITISGSVSATRKALGPFEPYPEWWKRTRLPALAGRRGTSRGVAARARK